MIPRSKSRVKKSMAKSYSSIIVVISIIFLSIPIYSYSSQLIERVNTQLPNNIYINGVHVGGQPIIEIEKYIDALDDEQIQKEIVITFTDDLSIQKYTFTLKELGLHSNKNEIKGEIQGILNHDSTFIRKFQEFKSVETEGRSFEISYSFDKDIFLNKMSAFNGENLKRPKNAEYVYKNGDVLIEGGEYGLTFDQEKLIEEIENNILNDISNYTLKTKNLKPEITKEDLEKQGIKEKVTSFKTTYNRKQMARTTNIRLATDMINGYILRPGEIFSFNEVVGKRTKARGFKEAGIYVNGKLDTGVGGGICQVSTTLYNSVLLADLEIIERSNHSLTVPYVPLSRDAAINWGSKDLKFRNNTEHYIYIHGEAKENYVIFSLYSTANNKRVELISSVLNKIEPEKKYLDDDNLKIGEEVVEDSGHTGYSSKLIKNVYIGNELISSQTVSKDKYLTSPIVIRRGTLAELIDITEN